MTPKTSAGYPTLVPGTRPNSATASAFVNARKAAAARTCSMTERPEPGPRRGTSDNATNSKPVSAPAAVATVANRSRYVADTTVPPYVRSPTCRDGVQAEGAKVVAGPGPGWPLHCDVLPLNIKGASRFLRKWPSATLDVEPPEALWPETKGQAASLARVRGHPLHGAGIHAATACPMHARSAGHHRVFTVTPG